MEVVDREAPSPWVMGPSIVDALMCPDDTAGFVASMVDDVESRESLHDRSGHCFSAEEVACAWHVAPSTAEARLVTSVDLVRRLPATLDLLEAGAVSAAHARVLSDETI
jgi:hypothetical protein